MQAMYRIKDIDNKYHVSKLKCRYSYLKLVIERLIVTCDKKLLLFIINYVFSGLQKYSKHILLHMRIIYIVKKRLNITDFVKMITSE